MAKTSYLRFNPENREIEIEGSEKFVKDYFAKLQQMLPKLSGEGGKGLEATTILSVKKDKAKKKVKIEIPAPKKVVKIVGKKAGAKGLKAVSLIDKIVGLVQDSGKGMTTGELKEKTGLTNKQIWSVTSRAAKLGRIKTTQRGVYVPG